MLFSRTVPCLFLLLCLESLLAWLPLSSAAVSSTASYLVPYSACQQNKKVQKGNIGSGIDGIESLCLKSTTSLTTTLDNANKLFIGNSSNIGSFGALCVPIQYIVRVSDDGSSFIPADLPDYFATQTWSLPAFAPVPKGVSNQTVILNLINKGASLLSLSGVNLTLLGLPADFSVAPGETKKVKFDRSLVDQTYTSLPLLQSFLSGENQPVIEQDTAVIIVQRFSDDPTGLLALASYVILSPQDDVTTPFKFHLYEATFYATPTGSRRRLLAVPGKAKSPPTTCARACCKALNPPPPTCKPGKPGYPGCKTKCSCSCS